MVNSIRDDHDRPEIADKTYIEPLTLKTLTAIIEKNALMPCCRLSAAKRDNLSVELYENGVLDKFGVQMIGANKRDQGRRDRGLFKAAMDRSVFKVPRWIRSYVGRGGGDR